jgi:hypothetical protein
MLFQLKQRVLNHKKMFLNKKKRNLKHVKYVQKKTLLVFHS